LDAVKDQKAREAVRSVLERFTGGAKPVAPDTAASAPAPAAAPADAAKSN
jgi:AsmA protein